ncbi:uncharacterized protein VTP21DRAFT_6072 [Calcarisporiella thermophila]|uniref:uncharacterized protein n=1 Tax=Calcarisporiella thermophila TaxID=911321 RepID=UPI0037431AA3
MYGAAQFELLDWEHALDPLDTSFGTAFHQSLDTFPNDFGDLADSGDGILGSYAKGDATSLLRQSDPLTGYGNWPNIADPLVSKGGLAMPLALATAELAGKEDKKIGGDQPHLSYESSSQWLSGDTDPSFAYSNKQNVSKWGNQTNKGSDCTPSSPQNSTADPVQTNSRSFSNGPAILVTPTDGSNWREESDNNSQSIEKPHDIQVTSENAAVAQCLPSPSAEVPPGEREGKDASMNTARYLAAASNNLLQQLAHGGGDIATVLSQNLGSNYGHYSTAWLEQCFTDMNTPTQGARPPTALDDYLKQLSGLNSGSIGVPPQINLYSLKELNAYVAEADSALLSMLNETANIKLKRQCEELFLPKMQISVTPAGELDSPLSVSPSSRWDPQVYSPPQLAPPSAHKRASPPSPPATPTKLFLPGSGNGYLSIQHGLDQDDTSPPAKRQFGTLRRSASSIACSLSYNPNLNEDDTVTMTSMAEEEDDDDSEKAGSELFNVDFFFSGSDARLARGKKHGMAGRKGEKKYGVNIPRRSSMPCLSKHGNVRAHAVDACTRE